MFSVFSVKFDVKKWKGTGFAGMSSWMINNKREEKEMQIEM